MKTIEEFKESNKHFIQTSLSINGGLQPTITMFVEDKKNNSQEVLMIPLPPEAFKNDESKDIIIAQILPKIFEVVSEENMIPLCISWSSEAWIRKAALDSPQEVLDNWRALPKEEVLFTSYETETESSVEIYKIFRDGKMAKEDGTLIDAIRLEKFDVSPNDEIQETDPKIEGRFSNLFKKYVKK